MNFALGLILLGLKSALAFAGPMCPAYEIAGRLQCDSKDLCQVVVHPGSFSEKKISLIQVPSLILNFNGSYIRAKVISTSQKENNFTAVLGGPPIRIPAPDQGYLKKEGERPCP